MTQPHLDLRYYMEAAALADLEAELGMCDTMTPSDIAGASNALLDLIDKAHASLNRGALLPSEAYRRLRLYTLVERRLRMLLESSTVAIGQQIVV